MTGGDDDYSKPYISTVWKLRDKYKFILNGTSQMNNGRSGHQCGIFRSNQHGGRPLLVASGVSTCEFFDFTKPNSVWQLCSKFNNAIRSHPLMMFTLEGDSSPQDFQALAMLFGLKLWLSNLHVKWKKKLGLY